MNIIRTLAVLLILASLGSLSVVYSEPADIQLVHHRQQHPYHHWARIRMREIRRQQRRREWRRRYGPQGPRAGSCQCED